MSYQPLGEPTGHPRTFAPWDEIPDDLKFIAQVGQHRIRKVRIPELDQVDFYLGPDHPSNPLAMPRKAAVQ